MASPTPLVSRCVRLAYVHYTVLAARVMNFRHPDAPNRPGRGDRRGVLE